MPLDIPIGREARLAHWQALSDHWAQVQIDTPAESLAREATVPPPEFATSPVFQLRGGRYQVLAWLPGEHPRECMWWEELDLWVLLQSVEPVARPLRIFTP